MSGDQLSSAQFVKGPYLIYPGRPDAMTVLWQTDSTPLLSTVEWTTLDHPEVAQAVAVPEIGSGPSGHQFAYTFTGLHPGQTVTYRVTADFSQQGGFFASPSTPDARSLVFYGYGDTRYPAATNPVHAAIERDVQADPLRRDTFILHAGDYNKDSMSESDWNSQFFNRDQVATGTYMPDLALMGVIGNHEITFPKPAPAGALPDGALLRKYLPYPEYATPDHLYYSFDYGPVHVAAVDLYTAPFTPGSAQYAWLESDLAASKAPYLMVLYHEPAYDAGTVFAPGEPAEDLNNPDVRTYLAPLFERMGVQVAVQGHNHYYSRDDFQGMTFLTLGGGGAPLTTPDPSYTHVERAVSANSFCRFEITGDVMTGTVLDTSGNVIDSFAVAARHPLAAGLLAA